MTPRQLLYRWKTDYKAMRKWSRFNSGVDAVKALGELTKFEQCINELEEVLNPKPSPLIESLVQRQLGPENDSCRTHGC